MVGTIPWACKGTSRGALKRDAGRGPRKAGVVRSHRRRARRTGAPAWHERRGGDGAPDGGAIALDAARSRPARSVANRRAAMQLATDRNRRAAQVPRDFPLA